MSTLEYRSVVPADMRPVRGTWMLWAIYLAMSWTWCIGMFLPVLLVRDFGVWGWVVFAIPNVIGAAAVGWINRTADQSLQTVAAHHAAMTAFSWVTATFQIFFAFWIFSKLSSVATIGTIAVMGFAFLVAILAAKYSGGGVGVGLFVFAASIACIVIAWYTGHLEYSHNLAKAVRRLPNFRVVELFAATSFGFLLCPHLDLTFHRARQRLSEPESKLAFGVGLGSIFPGMIVFTLFYIPLMGWALAGNVSWNLIDRWVLLAYLFLQLGFTTGIHWQGGELIRKKRLWSRVAVVAVATSIAGLLIGMLSPHIAGLKGGESPRPAFDNLGGGEILYRIFLSAYGLLFPAYVWLCMLPGGWIRPPSQRQWTIFVIAVLVAAPMFWMSFIEQKMIWVLPGVAVPLAARLIIRSPARTASFSPQ